MAKKIKFNLSCDGVPVRSIKDLQENFAVEDVLVYYKNKTLHRWLDARGFEKELEAVSSIESDNDEEILRRLIEIFDVTSDADEIESILESVRYVAERKQRREAIDNTPPIGKEELQDAEEQPVEEMKSEPKPTAEVDADAEVKGVQLHIDRAGYRDIQLQLMEPVVLNGTKYDSVPVLSVEEFKKLSLREGAVIEVHRKGRGIPTIAVQREGQGKVLELPTSCSCGTALTIRNGNLYCSNFNCYDNVISRITGFFEGIGLDGYGEAFAEIVTKEKEFDTSLASLFKLTPDEFAQHGVTTKDAKKFQDKFRAAIAQCPDYKILSSIGVPDLGPARAKLILRESGGWSGFMNDLENRDATRIIKALGWNTGSLIADWIIAQGSRNGVKSIVAELKVIGSYMNIVSSMHDYDLRIGYTAVKPSPNLLSFCNKRGFELVDGEDFDVLVTVYKDLTSDKAAQARKHHLPVLTEREFMNGYEDKSYEIKTEIKKIGRPGWIHPNPVKGTATYWYNEHYLIYNGYHIHC